MSDIRWLERFETMCARYKCRQLSEIDIDIEDDLFVHGPSGMWLAEIASISFDNNGSIETNDCEAAIRLGRRVCDSVRCNDHRTWRRRDSDNDDDDDDAPTVAMDWFVHGATMSREDSVRQCMVRICRNSRQVTIILLCNTTKHGDTPASSLTFSRYNDRLIPFVFVLINELIHREYDFDVLNMHYERLTSSTRFAKEKEERRRRQRSGDCGDDDGGAAGWLELARETHSRGRLVRVGSCPLDSRLFNDIVTIRSVAGRVRYNWRDGRSVRDYGVQKLAPDTLLNLRDLDQEIKTEKTCILKLCDHDVFSKRCYNFLLHERNVSILRNLNYCDDDDESHDAGAADGDECAREKRYYVDRNGTLRSSRYVSFS